MGTNIFKGVAERFLSMMKGSSASPRGRICYQVTRADGTVESFKPSNIVLATGLNMAAERLAVNTDGGAISHIAIGTVTDQHSLGSVNFGEVARKSATVTTSKMALIATNCWGGDSDSITGIPLGSAALVNNANSGEGTLLNMTNSLAVTLQASDVLRVQAEVYIGSHNL